MQDVITQLIEAAKLYKKWAQDTGDYPHDEQGCIAHDAIIEAVERIEKAEEQ